MLVIDSSVILAAVLPDEESHYAEVVLDQLEEGAIAAHVPALFHLEAANVLAMTQRRQRINARQAIQGMQAIGCLPLAVDTEASFPPAIERMVPLINTYHLTAYDACYLELALRRQFQIATLDKSLRAAAEQEKVYYQP